MRGKMLFFYQTCCGLLIISGFFFFGSCWTWRVTKMRDHLEFLGISTGLLHITIYLLKSFATIIEIAFKKNILVFSKYNL